MYRFGREYMEYSPKKYSDTLGKLQFQIQKAKQVQLKQHISVRGPHRLNMISEVEIGDTEKNIMGAARQ